MAERQLTALPVRDFVELVASSRDPVPAGASVAALTGAASAALLVLACDVIEHHNAGLLEEHRRRARDLQEQLLVLVDEDADAYRAYLTAERGSIAGQAAAARAAEVPLAIGRACSHVAELAHAVAPSATGAIRLDVSAARQLSHAASRSAIEIAQHNLGLAADAGVRGTLQKEIARLIDSGA